MTLATFLVNDMVSQYGFPHLYIHGTQDTNICSNVVQALCDILGIQRMQTFAYIPSIGNGQIDQEI